MGAPEKFGEPSSSVKEDVADWPLENGKKKQKKSAPALGKVASTSSNKIDLIHLEDIRTTPEKTTRWKKTKRHFARFWLCYIIAGVIFAAIALPLLFLKVVPALAQLLVDKTGLPIYRGSLKAMSDTKVIIGIDTALSVPGGLTVGLDPLELWLYNKNTTDFIPYVMVPLDKQKVKGHTEINVTDTVVGVGDREELYKWLKTMLYQKEADISVRGNTTAHLGALHFDIKLKKTVQIDALDTLRGFALTDSALLLPPDDDGTNLIGNLTLPNWSDLEIGLGNLTFNAFAGDLLIGNVAVFNVNLPPKSNVSLAFRGEIFLPVVTQNLFQILDSQTQALTKGNLEVGISGNSTIVDGEHITYLERVLNEAHILSQVPLMQLLVDVVRSVLDGDMDLGGLGDALMDGLGPLIDDIFDGDGDNPLGDLLGDGNMTVAEAKLTLSHVFAHGKL